MEGGGKMRDQTTVRHLTRFFFLPLILERGKGRNEGKRKLVSVAICNFYFLEDQGVIRKKVEGI